MSQDDAPCREQEGAVAALGSHLELLARLLHRAAAGGEGLPALRGPLLDSGALLSRGLEGPGGREQSPRAPPRGEAAAGAPRLLGAGGAPPRGLSSGAECPGGARLACGHKPGPGLEECGSPGRERSPTKAPWSGAAGGASPRGPEGGPGDDARPGCGHRRPWDGSPRSPRHSVATDSDETLDRSQVQKIRSKSQEWAEDEMVLQELRRDPTMSRSRSLDHGDPTRRASRGFCCLRGIVGNARYEIFWATVVMVNTLTMILEEEWTGILSGNRIGVYEKYGSDEFMDQWWPSADVVFFSLDCVFCLMFTVELTLTLTYDIWNRLLGFKVHFRHPFWNNPWDWLDIMIVVLSNLALFAGVGGVGNGPISDARFFRVFRVVRLLRLVRLARRINALDPLHLMTTAIRGSATALVFSIMLLLLIQTMFAMMMTQVLRYGWLSEGSSSLPESVEIELFKYFGTFTRSMVTMFELTLANYAPVCRLLMDDVHEAFGCLVVLYKLSVGFAVIAIINGVFIQETFSVVQNDEFITARKRRRQMEQFTQTITRLFKMADTDDSGTLTRGELSLLVKKDYIRTCLEALDLRCADADMLVTLIAGDGHEVSIDEFVDGIGRLKGTARNIDLIAVFDMLQQQLHNLQLVVEDIPRHSPPAAS